MISDRNYLVLLIISYFFLIALYFLYSINSWAQYRCHVSMIPDQFYCHWHLLQRNRCVNKGDINHAAINSFEQKLLKIGFLTSLVWFFLIPKLTRLLRGKKNLIVWVFEGHYASAWFWTKTVSTLGCNQKFGVLTICSTRLRTR